MPDKTPQDNVTDINEAKKIIKKEKKDKDGPSPLEIFRIHQLLLNQDTISHSNVFPNKFPHKFVVYKTDKSKKPEIYEIVKTDNGLRYELVTEDSKALNIDYIMECLIKYLDKEIDKTDIKKLGYKCSHDGMIAESIQRWILRAKKQTDRRKLIAFKDDPEPAHWRVPFNTPRANDCTIADFETRCPTWAEICSRMPTNYEIFLSRIWSIFDENANRKQAVYVWGEKDVGKSQIQSVLTWMCGGTDPNSVFTTVSNEDLNSPHWRGILRRKRVLIVSEAKTAFLNSEAFKAMTGDSVHSINPKGKDLYTIDINCLFFFFSNDPPAIQSKPELIERIIPCRLASHGLSNDKLLGEKEYQQRLKDELPDMLSFARELYENGPKNGRFNCNREDIIEASSEKECSPVSVFEQHFEVSENKNDFIEYREIREKLLFNKVDEKFHNYYVDVWKRRFGIVYKSKRIPNHKDAKYVYTGMRSKISPY